MHRSQLIKLRGWGRQSQLPGSDLPEEGGGRAASNSPASILLYVSLSDTGVLRLILPKIRCYQMLVVHHSTQNGLN